MVCTKIWLKEFSSHRLAYCFCHTLASLPALLHGVSLSGSFETERLIAICVIYFLALGISAHLLDAVGGKTKPWGDLPKRKLWTVSMIVLGIAFTIGMYYAFLDSPLLFAIGIAEGFFLFCIQFRIV